MHFLAFAVGLRVHHDRVLLIDHRYAVVALQRAVAGRHLRAVRIGNVAFVLLARPMFFSASAICSPVAVNS